MRPWAEFFGPVTSPKWTQLDVKKRVFANVNFFKTNYLILCIACSLFYIITSPGLLVILLLSAVMFLYVFLSRRKPLVVGEIALGTREKLIASTIVCSVMLSFSGYIFTLQYSAIIGSLICLLHAVLRPPVARAVRGGGDPRVATTGDDLEGGGKVGQGGRSGPVNANMRLRSRPGVNADYSGSRIRSGHASKPAETSAYPLPVQMADPGAPAVSGTSKVNMNRG
ncbi:unnamed protein product [Choristocarpus tenellus]